MLTDGRTTDNGVTGILISHLGAFGSGELKRRGVIIQIIHKRSTALEPRNDQGKIGNAFCYSLFR